jgi:hypothetical protein
MRYAAGWSALCVLCFSTTQAPAQPLVCGGDYVCLVDTATAGPVAPPTQPAVVAEPEKPAADPRCPAIPLDVIAETSQDRDMACSAAKPALEQLGQCGITLRRPLRLEILRDVRHPFGKHSIFGFFDNKLETIYVTSASSAVSLVAGTPYSELPHRDFYSSLIVHEIVHGVMHQNFKVQPSSHAAYEYPAYAIQIAALPSDVRSKFLQSFPEDASPNEYVLNDNILFFDPFHFAARAYRHFTAADGCAHLTALLQGEVAFIPTLH